jgi:hypothetical protein
VGTLFLFLWLVPGVFSLSGLDQRELFEAIGLLGIMLFAWIFRLRFKLAADTAQNRIFSVTCFLLAALFFSPPFHRSIAVGTYTAPSTLSGNTSVWISCLSILAFSVWARITLPPLGADIKTQTHSPADRLEVWLSRLSVRLNLAVALAIFALAGLALAAFPFKTLPLRIAVLSSFTLGLKPILQFARVQGSQRILQSIATVALLGVLLCGGLRYKELHDCIAAGASELAKGDTVAATRWLDQARNLNKLFYSKSQEIAIEQHWAQFYEKNNLPGEALQRWQQIAAIRGIDSNTFPPVLRMKCRLGDSIAVWQRAVFEGFDEVDYTDILPGIEGLADTSGDIRANLLAALLAWKRHTKHEATEAECRKRLEDVQRVAPHEPTSYNLLRRMGVSLPPAVLWLPDSLIVGRSKAGRYAGHSDIAELGVVETLVLLDQGQWEIGLKGSAVPLNGIWPIIRVELNGHEIGRTQVTRTEEHEMLPFVCEVNRGTLYNVKITFENQESDVKAGHKSMRGLSISGISFRKKE